MSSSLFVKTRQILTKTINVKTFYNTGYIKTLKQKSRISFDAILKHYYSDAGYFKFENVFVFAATHQNIKIGLGIFK